MKTAELEGDALEHWFAIAAGFYAEGSILSDWFEDTHPWFGWAEVGPIIERMKVGVIWSPGKDDWCAACGRLPLSGMCNARSKSVLVAVMRCVVASKYGDKVPEDDVAQEIVITERAPLSKEEKVAARGAILEDSFDGKPLMEKHV